MATTNYLITGANRGIGRGLTEVFLSRPNTTVVAAVRDPSSPSSKELLNLPTGPFSKLILVKIDSKCESDAATAVKEIQAQGITHLDIVIANAGICTDFSRVDSVPISALKEHVEVNAYGPLYLFQAVYPLLQKSQKPTFAGIGSQLASISGMEQLPFPAAAYGPSKAVLHFMVRKIHFENPNFISFIVDPGLVQTDMGNGVAETNKLGKAFQTVEESVTGVVKAIDGATRETVGGRLRAFDGSESPW